MIPDAKTNKTTHLCSTGDTIYINRVTYMFMISYGLNLCLYTNIL